MDIHTDTQIDIAVSINHYARTPDPIHHGKILGNMEYVRGQGPRSLMAWMAPFVRGMMSPFANGIIGPPSTDIVLV